MTSAIDQIYENKVQLKCEIPNRALNHGDVIFDSEIVSVGGFLWMVELQYEKTSAIKSGLPHLGAYVVCKQDGAGWKCKESSKFKLLSQSSDVPTIEKCTTSQFPMNKGTNGWGYNDFCEWAILPKYAKGGEFTMEVTIKVEPSDAIGGNPHFHVGAQNCAIQTLQKKLDEVADEFKEMHDEGNQELQANICNGMNRTQEKIDEIAQLHKDQELQHQLKMKAILEELSRAISLIDELTAHSRVHGEGMGQLLKKVGLIARPFEDQERIEAEIQELRTQLVNEKCEHERKEKAFETSLLVLEEKLAKTIRQRDEQDLARNDLQNKLDEATRTVIDMGRMHQEEVGGLQAQVAQSREETLEWKKKAEKSEQFDRMKKMIIELDDCKGESEDKPPIKDDDAEEVCSPNKKPRIEE